MKRNEKARSARWPHVTDAEYIERMKSRMTVLPNGCWQWTGYILPTGYASISYRGKGWRAHRLMCLLVHGDFPREWDVMHLCDNPSCINPDHIKAAPTIVNMHDMRRKNRDINSPKTHCPRGHDYAVHGRPVHSYGYAPWRQCKICNRAKQRIRAGWPEDLAYSADATPFGKHVVGANWKHKKNRATSGEGAGHDKAG